MNLCFAAEILTEAKAGLNEDISYWNAGKKVAPFLVAHLNGQVRKMAREGGRKSTNIQHMGNACLAQPLLRDICNVNPVTQVSRDSEGLTLVSAKHTSLLKAQ